MLLKQKYEETPVFLRTKTLLLELCNKLLCSQWKGSLLSSYRYQTNLCCDNVFETQQKECALVASPYQLQW